MGVAILGLFVAYPLVKLGVSAFQSPRGAFAPEMFWPRVSDVRIWRADGPLRTTILLGFASATSSTVLALAFGLMTERTQTPGRRLLRMLSILPIITPPFVLGLSVILLFGRNGALNRLLEIAFGIEPTRWIYGFQGVWFAQTLAFTPIAYLVLVSVLKGMNPALEEAAQTLRGSPAYVLRPSPRCWSPPASPNAFLVVFAQSLADFGNPLLLGGDMQVLSTAIYFAVVGARQDRSVAAVLALILLGLMMSVFLGQRAILSGRAYTTVLGKVQAGRRVELPAGPAQRRARPCLSVGPSHRGRLRRHPVRRLRRDWGLDNSFTLKHYRAAFGIVFDGGLRFTGQAWPSLATTAVLAAIAAPLTAGSRPLPIAYLIERRLGFAGRTVDRVLRLTYRWSDSRDRARHRLYSPPSTTRPSSWCRHSASSW